MNRRYLLVKQKHKRTQGIWDEVLRSVPFDVEMVDQKDALHFRQVMDRLRNGHGYDRVVFDCNLRNIGSQVWELKGVEGLVIYDNDLYHHYNPRSSYAGMFVALFKTLPPHRIISTGLYTVRGFEKEGLNVSYLPKSYNPGYVGYLGLECDIEIAFIGRIKNKVYADRKRLLEGLRAELGVQILRTSEDDDYNVTLNRIRFFLSADQGLNEHMAKNFEAMAAGCILCTAPTIGEETEYLGFRDMENVVFYESPHELRDKISLLRKDSARAEAIAQAGRALVETRHCDRNRAIEIIPLIEAPMVAPPPMNLADRLALVKLRAHQFLSRS